MTRQVTKIETDYAIIFKKTTQLFIKQKDVTIKHSFGFFDNEVSVDEQKNPKSTDDLVEAILRNKREMSPPDGVDVNFDRVLDAERDYWSIRGLAYAFVSVIINNAHINDGLWKRFKLERSLKDLEEQINHVQDCPKCKQVMNQAVMAINYINIIPRIVTREDGEKALKYLAEKNNMSEAEFREWINKASDQIIKEMNDTDKSKTD